MTMALALTPSNFDKLSTIYNSMRNALPLTVCQVRDGAEAIDLTAVFLYAFQSLYVYVYYIYICICMYVYV